MMDLKVLNLPLTILKVTGLDPRDNTMLSKVKCFILFVTIFILLVTSMMEIQGQKRSIISIVSEIEAFMAAMEVSSIFLNFQHDFDLKCAVFNINNFTDSHSSMNTFTCKFCRVS